jgi:hypothetical protein
MAATGLKNEKSTVTSRAGRSMPQRPSTTPGRPPSARLLHVDEQGNGMEKLQQLIANFVEHRSPVAGGCPILNTAVEADDGNAILRARVAQAFRSWLSRLEVKPGSTARLSRP